MVTGTSKVLDALLNDSKAVDEADSNEVASVDDEVPGADDVSIVRLHDIDDVGVADSDSDVMDMVLLLSVDEAVRDGV